MTEKNDTHKAQVSVTSLYDPVIGFLYAHELFERDLYREKMIEARGVPTTGQPKISGRMPMGRSNP